VLGERRLAPADADGAERVGKRGTHEDDQRDRRRDQAQIGKAHPQDQLVGPVGGDVEHPAEQGGAPRPPGHGAIDGVEHEPDEEERYPGHAGRRQPQVQREDGRQQDREAGERDPIGQHRVPPLVSGTMAGGRPLRVTSTGLDAAGASASSTQSRGRDE